MKLRIPHSFFILILSALALFGSSIPVHGSSSEPINPIKKATKPSSTNLVELAAPSSLGRKFTLPFLSRPVERFPWKANIVTTVFWIGEKPSGSNPVPNRSSSWDANWSRSYGGYDDPEQSRRRDFIPVAFMPKQNPFYCALPYNDKSTNGHRSEAPQVVPWFKEAYQGPSVSTCKGRWVAIRKGNRVAYAQWEDAGPFRTDHWQYVFGNERPKPNLNKGAGLDVSPAIRDYLGLEETDVTDWKFVEFAEVPHGPWSKHGENNTFVINSRRNNKALVEGPKRGGMVIVP